MISVSTSAEYTVSTVSRVRPDLIGPCSIGQASVTAADDADGADANAAFCARV